MKANVILKNLAGILCGATVLCFLLPFAAVSVSVSVMGASNSNEQAINGLSIITEGGIFGILLFLMPILILAANYIPAVTSFKKYVCLGASAVGIILMFIIPKILSSANASVGGEAASAEVSVKYGIGFWLMLIFMLANAALSVIQFFNLKGNKVFDAVNYSDDSEVNGQGVKIPNINTEKITNFTRNITERITQKQEKPTEINSATTVQPIAQANQASSNTVYSPVATAVSEKEDPEEVMERIRKLHDLKAAGILTDEEFTEKKQEMLKLM